MLKKEIHKITRDITETVLNVANWAIWDVIAVLK